MQSGDSEASGSVVGMRLVRVIVALVTFSFGCAFALNCSAQSANCVSVRVLNPKNGKPVEGVLIHFLPNSSANPYTADATVNIGKTDKQGITKYCIPGSVPRLEFYEFSGPDERENFDTDVVLKFGFVANNSLHGAKFIFTRSPKPGEVVIFGQRWWLVDRWIGPWP